MLPIKLDTTPDLAALFRRFNIIVTGKINLTTLGK
jgi:hypothetical protein